MAQVAPELAILRHLVGRTPASAHEIGRTCSMTPGEVRARLVMLETMRLVSSRPGWHGRASRRAYAVTAEGRRKAGISDARGNGVT